MLCSKCGMKDASFHYKQISGGNKTELHLCSDCAKELGYIKGLYVDGKLCFEPERAITRAEAAVMLGNMINASTPTIAPVFSDADTVPAWASASLSSLTAMGIIDTANGNVEALSSVTRADAAQMLANLLVTVE